MLSMKTPTGRISFERMMFHPSGRLPEIGECIPRSTEAVLEDFTKSFYVVLSIYLPLSI